MARTMALAWPLLAWARPLISSEISSTSVAAIAAAAVVTALSRLAVVRAARGAAASLVPIQVPIW